MSFQLGQCFTTCEVESEIKVVEVQAFLRRGLSRFDIIGLPKSMIREGRDRILSALHSLGLNLSNQKILINLQPSDLPKEGAHFDLPILVSLLDALGHLSIEGQKFAWGEVLLDGRVKTSEQLLSHQLIAESKNASRLILSSEASTPDSLADLFRCERSAIENCRELWALPRQTVTKKAYSTTSPSRSIHGTDWNKLRGSARQFELFCIAALGRQHILLEGSPGVGKTFWSHALAELQPALSKDQLIDRLQHQLSSKEELSTRSAPFETPHHSSSMAALVGGGSQKLHLGSITRAHCGILFLDEFGEFNRQAIEALREPMEKKSISISRGGKNKSFPADIQLVAAMNPCPCGNFESPRLCHCSSLQIDRYRSKVSAAIKQRFHWKLQWNFYDQVRPKEYDYQNVIAKLQRSREQKVQIKDAPSLKNSISGREQKIIFEKAIAWARWNGVSELTRNSWSRYFEFQESWENEKSSDIELRGDPRATRRV